MTISSSFPKLSKHFLFQPPELSKQYSKQCFSCSQADDDGVSEEELSTVLLSSLTTAHVILDSVEDTGETRDSHEEELKLIETVQR